MKRLFVLIGMSCAILAANAQTTFSVKELAVSTSYKETKCRLTKENLESEVRSLMRYNRIGITDDIEAPYLFVSAVLVTTNAGCVGGMRIKIMRFQHMEDKWLRRRHFSNILFCDQHGVFTTPPEAMLDQAGTSARALFNACLNEMERDAFARK